MNLEPTPINLRVPEVSTQEETVVEDGLVHTVVPAGVDREGAKAAVLPLEAHESVIHRMAAQRRPEKREAAPRYVVRKEVGRGAMGRIFSVRDQDLNRLVAMKVLKRERIKPKQMRRFIEEAQINGQLEHPNVLPVHDFGLNAEGEVFFTMKFVEGHLTLQEIIRVLRAGDRQAHEKFTLQYRVQLVMKVCNALSYAHERGVVHRDIKPANIIVGELGEVYLADWGIAKVIAGTEDEPNTVQTSGDSLDPDATADGVFLGTVGYMSPEQAKGLNSTLDAVSDGFSLGAVLFELLSLNHYLPELTDRSARGVAAAILSGTRTKAESYKHPVQGRVPRHLSRICAKTLKMDREERFQSATELHNALKEWLEGNSPVVCPGTFIQRILIRYSRFIDLYPVLAPTITITGLVLLLASVGLSAVYLSRLIS